MVSVLDPQQDIMLYLLYVFFNYVLYVKDVTTYIRLSVLVFTGYYTMSAVTNTFENVKAVILSAHESSTTVEKLNFYNSWAQNYDQVWEI